MTEAARQEADEPSDAMLIATVRRGDVNAYGVLYERHLGSARRASACLAASSEEREDLVAEAFTRVLRVIRSGGGPVEQFRPYLLVTMRNVAINATRASSALAWHADVPDLDPPATCDDPIIAQFHNRLAVTAFASLPERWRTVLWHTEIEGESPAAIASMLGMKPNSVAALAYRAREGLRRAYLQLHLPSVKGKDCREAADRLGGWVRHGLSPAKMREISAHIERCKACRELAASLTAVNHELRAVLAPLVLGAPLANAYLQAAKVFTASPGAAMAAAASGAGATTSGLSAVKVALAATACKIGTAAAIATASAVTVAASQPHVTARESAPATSATSQASWQPTDAKAGATKPTIRKHPGRGTAAADRPVAEPPAPRSGAAAKVTPGVDRAAAASGRPPAHARSGERTASGPPVGASAGRKQGKAKAKAAGGHPGQRSGARSRR